MIIQNWNVSVAMTYTQGQKSKQNLNITNSIEVTIIGVARGGEPRSPPIEMPPKIKMWQKSLVSSFSVSFSIFAYNSTRLQH